MTPSTRTPLARLVTCTTRGLALVVPAVLAVGLLAVGSGTSGTTDDLVPAAAALSGAGRPAAYNTGVPKNLKLRVHRGNLTITRAGTKIDAMDIRGFVSIKAPNVTITRSIVRGGTPPRDNVGLITNYGYRNLVVRATTLKATKQTVWVDGIKGSNFTLDKVHVSGNVDSVKIQGDNVKITRSLLEDTVYWKSDPFQGGGPTHNDNIQIQKGRNITIARNTIRGAQNFAILGAASIGNTPNLKVLDNWVDGGHCTVKLETRKSYALRATVTGNVFGPNRKVQSCPMVATSTATVSAANNLLDSGDPVRVQRWDG
ncbi:MAG: hypothetical protein Q7T56_10085 [Nocardioidaceae bacterium]|nr:hypothetical protein [Nocardioidaceae bacterium]